jgi:hypothetical protein
MANSQVRSLGGPAVLQGPLGKRASLRLSGGSLISIVADNNKSGTAGAGGDNSNTGKLYIYLSFDDITWSLKNTLVTSLGAVATSFIVYSACVDSADSIHIVWIDTTGVTGTVKYIKYTYSAGTFTPGTATTIYTGTANFGPTRVDIDAFANNQAVCAVYTESNVGSGSAIGAIANAITLNASGAVINSIGIQVLSGRTSKVGSQDITISATHDAIVSNIGTYMMIATAQPVSGSDAGDNILVAAVNLSTGANVSTTQDSIPLGGLPGRRYMLFCADGAREMVYGVMTSGLGAIMGYRRLNITSGYALSYETSLQTVKLASNVPDVPPGTSYENASMQYSGNGSGVLTYGYIYAGTNVYNVTAQTLVNTFRNAPLLIDQGYTAPNNSLSCISGGGNKNFAAVGVSFLVHCNRLGYTARCVFPPVALAPSGPVPASGATVQTGLPAIGSNFEMPYSRSAGLVQQFYYIAKDAGLTTSRKTILSPFKIAPVNADPVNNATVTDLIQLTNLAYELSQGVWYVGTYTYDEWGSFSPISPVTSFTVSHPPAPANLHPNGGQVLAFGTGVISFAWTFTDPYVNDHQTGYQLQIQDNTGTSIYDSGIVTSTAISANVTLSATYKDVQLQWRVSLLDKDSVQGAYSDWQAFYISDAPVVTVTSPTPAQVFTTGIPTIAWTNGISGAKSQASYAVSIADAASGQVVYYSGVIASAATSFNIPTGTIHNSKSYRVSVTVIDSLGLSSSSASVGFSTAWTPPAAADIVRAYLYRYVSDGYIFIGWSNLNLDSRFIAWNLYRRAIGTSAWTLLETVTYLDSSYGYRDYDVRAGNLYQYAVTQVVNVSGDQIESVLAVQATLTVPSASYWLIDPLGVVPSVPLFNVTQDKYTIEQETAVYTVVGVGRHVDEGDILGANGSLTVELRDRPTGLITSVNQFLNPSQQASAIVNLPDNWTFAATGSFGTASTDYLSFYEPAPNGYLQNFVMRSSALGNTGADTLTLTQSVTVDRLPVAPGSQFDHSEWLAVEQVAGNVVSAPVVKSVVSYFNAASGLISTETITTTLVDTYEPTTSGDLYTGSWKRYKARHTMPALTDHMTVKTTVGIGTAGAYGVIMGGSQLEANITPYFDGDSRSAAWTGAQYISSSYNAGYYTATSQRTDIQNMKNIGRPLYIKTPFGQSFYVKLSNNDFDRLAGVTAEFGTMTLPYLEVAF